MNEKLVKCKIDRCHSCLEMGHIIDQNSSNATRIWPVLNLKRHLFTHKIKIIGNVEFCKILQLRRKFEAKNTSILVRHFLNIDKWNVKIVSIVLTNWRIGLTAFVVNLNSTFTWTTIPVCYVCVITLKIMGHSVSTNLYTISVWVFLKAWNTIAGLVNSIKVVFGCYIAENALRCTILCYKCNASKYIDADIANSLSKFANTAVILRIRIEIGLVAFYTVLLEI